MSLSNIIIKGIGVILALVGLDLLLAAVGIPLFGAGLSSWIWDVIVGILFLGVGIYIVRGGNILP